MSLIDVEPSASTAAPSYSYSYSYSPDVLVLVLVPVHVLELRARFLQLCPDSLRERPSTLTFGLFLAGKDFAQLGFGHAQRLVGELGELT
jgi:hypothetical protein